MCQYHLLDYFASFSCMILITVKSVYIALFWVHGNAGADPGFLDRAFKLTKGDWIC